MVELLQSPWLWVTILLAFSAAQLAIGVTLGHRMSGKRNRAESEAARQYLQQVQELAARVNSRVGEHQQQLGAINEGLRTAEESEAGLTRTDLSKATEQLFGVNRDLEAELEAVRAELAQRTTQLESQMLEARTDALTGLVNRRAFDEELRKRFAQWQRQHVPLAVILLDVDHFKKFNDKHGHQAGDKVLRVVAGAFRQAMRDMDVVARYGGEEFVALLPATNLADAKELVEKARLAIEAALVPHGQDQLRVTASLGLAQAIAGDDETLLVSRSDAALYAAKGAGRNQSWFHNGRQSEPVLQPANKTAAALVEIKAAPRSLAAVEKEKADIERRQHVRRDFRASHYVAPYVNGMMPSPDKFFEVFSLDISSAGFAYMSDERPTFDALIVEFGEAPNLIYLSSRVVYCRPSNDPEMPKFKVGCKFMGRLHL